MVSDMIGGLFDEGLGTLVCCSDRVSKSGYSSVGGMLVIFHNQHSKLIMKVLFIRINIKIESLF